MLPKSIVSLLEKLRLYDILLSFFNKYMALRAFWRHRVIYNVARKKLLFSKISGLFIKGFASETQFVLNGVYQFFHSTKKGKDNQGLFRRYIHGLEKGLLMKEQRKVFALDYIIETVQLYRDLTSNNELDAGTAQWGRDVLTKYFEVTDNTHSTILKAQQLFIKSNQVEGSGLSCTPFTLTIEQYQPEVFEQFKMLTQNRKSVRWFNSEKVNREIVDKAIEVAGMAPSGCNRQPYQFAIIDDTQKAQKIGKLAAGTKGFLENIHSIIVVVGQSNHSSSIADKHIMYVDGSLASMNLMLALESLSVRSCPLNWPDIAWKDQSARKQLGLKSYEKPIMLIAYGYADMTGKVAWSQRKDIEQIRYYV